MNNYPIIVRCAAMFSNGNRCQKVVKLDGVEVAPHTVLHHLFIKNEQVCVCKWCIDNGALEAFVGDGKNWEIQFQSL